MLFVYCLFVCLSVIVCGHLVGDLARRGGGCFFCLRWGDGLSFGRNCRAGYHLHGLTMGEPPFGLDGLDLRPLPVCRASPTVGRVVPSAVSAKRPGGVPALTGVVGARTDGADLGIGATVSSPVPEPLAVCAPHDLLPVGFNSVGAKFAVGGCQPDFVWRLPFGVGVDFQHDCMPVAEAPCSVNFHGC